MVKYLRLSSYIREPFLIYDFATDPIRLIYEENFVFFFISVLYRQNRVAFGIETVHKIPLTVLAI
jgi:hypothetical protein